MSQYTKCSWKPSQAAQPLADAEKRPNYVMQPWKVSQSRIATPKVHLEKPKDTKIQANG